MIAANSTDSMAALLQQWKQGKERLPLSQFMKQKPELQSRLPRRSKPGIHF